MIIIIVVLILIFLISVNYKKPYTYNPDDLFIHLQYISDLLTKHNIKHWLMYGSLLGGVRQNDIIPYDYDFDLGAHIEDTDKILALNQHIGNYKFKKLHIGNTWRVSLKIFYKDIEMGDIYLYQKFNDGFMRRFDISSGTYFWPKSTFPAWFIEQLDKIKIRNTFFPTPRNPEILLEHWYGSTWKIPIKAKAQGGVGDDNSDYYGGAKYMPLNFLTNYIKSKNIYLQPQINNKIKIVYPQDQEIWIKENEMVI